MRPQLSGVRGMFGGEIAGVALLADPLLGSKVGGWIHFDRK